MVNAPFTGNLTLAGQPTLPAGAAERALTRRLAKTAPGRLRYTRTRPVAVVGVVELTAGEQTFATGRHFHKTKVSAHYSTTRSARNSSDWGILMASALAVFRLNTNS